MAFLLAPARALEPPPRGDIARYKADGSYRERLQFARELGNHRVSKTLAARYAARRQQKPAQAVPPAWQGGLPSSGAVKVFALLIDFPDYPHAAQDSTTTVDAGLFGSPAANFPHESLRNFYLRSSYNKLDITGATLGWYRYTAARSAIPMTTAGREALIKQAITYFAGQGHNFAQYDNDGDGAIDYFLVIWTGPDNGWANFWWGYQTVFQDGAYTAGGKTLRAYSWQYLYRSPETAFAASTVIHETGHALGLPDYYDYDGTIGPDGGVGWIDIMDGGSQDHNAFSKYLLEWLAPAIPAAGAELVTLRPLARYPDAAQFMPSGAAQSAFAEYFMVDNRQRAQADNDYYMPASGLLVWHVDATLNGYGTDFLYDNSYTAHKLLRLMEADSLEEIEQGYSADAGDFYVSGKSFGPGTTPNSSTYSGTPSGVSVANIGSGDTITFSINPLSALAQCGIGMKAYPNPWKPGSGGAHDAQGVTFRADAQGEAAIKIFTVAGVPVRELRLENTPAKQVLWDGKNSDGKNAASGVYFAVVDAGGCSFVIKAAVER